MQQKKVHLVLSPGGMKTIAYVGAIRCLLDNGYHIASVSCCSAGSLMGALLAAGIPIEVLETRILEIPFSKYIVRKRWGILNLLRYPYAMYRPGSMSALFRPLSGEDRAWKMGELAAATFATIAMDIENEEVLVYSSITHADMSVEEMLNIATAIPGFTEPVEKGGRVLLDAVSFSSSPVWLVSKSDPDEPVVVLKTELDPNIDYQRGLFPFIRKMVSASAKVSDNQIIKSHTEYIVVNIDCGKAQFNDFGMSRRGKELLIRKGAIAMNHAMRQLPSVEVQQVGAASDPENAAVQNWKRLAGFEAMGQRNQVFLSYHPSDQPVVNRLMKHLYGIRRISKVKVWTVDALLAGDDIQATINDALAATKVAILLLSADYFSDENLFNSELSYFLQKSRTDGVHVIWLRTRPAQVVEELFAIQPFSNGEWDNLSELSEEGREAVCLQLSREVGDLLVRGVNK